MFNNQMSQVEDRAQFIFTLTENIGDQDIFAHPGPWKIGHQKKMDDLVMGSDNRFFLANSLDREILGPFVQTTPQTHYSEGLFFKRKVPEILETNIKICHWVMEFDQVSEDYKITRGIPWDLVAKMLCLDINAWKSIRNLRLTEANFERLYDELSEFNVGTQFYLANFPYGAFPDVDYKSSEEMVPMDSEEEEFLASQIGYLEEVYGQRPS